jgi:hypothetical protein
LPGCRYCSHLLPPAPLEQLEVGRFLHFAKRVLWHLFFEPRSPQSILPLNLLLGIAWAWFLWAFKPQNGYFWFAAFSLFACGYRAGLGAQKSWPEMEVAP